MFFPRPPSRKIVGDFLGFRQIRAGSFVGLLGGSQNIKQKNSGRFRSMLCGVNSNLDGGNSAKYPLFL